MAKAGDGVEHLVGALGCESIQIYTCQFMQHSGRLSTAAESERTFMTGPTGRSSISYVSRNRQSWEFAYQAAPGPHANPQGGGQCPGEKGL
jgi:hypothetical protein